MEHAATCGRSFTKLIPTRVKADSFRGFQTGASQTLWRRTGGSPCGQGLHFVRFLRENWLSSRVFASYRDIVDHCCDAWNRLIDQPWIIMSIGLRDWAN